MAKSVVAINPNPILPALNSATRSTLFVLKPVARLMYLPSTCTFRMTDIWRSLIAQRCLWELGQGVVFHAADNAFPGWDEYISKARTMDDLPVNARDYVHAIEVMIGARISVIGVGPGRDESIVVHDLLGR